MKPHLPVWVLCILSAFVGTGLGADPASDAPKVLTTRKGPFKLGPGQGQTVTVEVRTFEFRKPILESPTTDFALIVRDPDGEVLYRRNYPAGDFEMRIVPAAVDLPGNRKALLVMRDFLPSAPGTGVVGQLFGFNRQGQFVPFTETMAPSHDDADPKWFPIQATASGRSPPAYVEIEEWTGNFTVVRYYPIDPEGVLSDRSSDAHSDQYPVRVDEKEARRWRKENYPKDNAISLHEAPRPAARHHRVPVPADARVEFLNATQDGSQWWLRVKINGQEGYVTGEEDFNRLGLRSAG